jgi:hypothetical protein
MDWSFGTHPISKTNNKIPSFQVVPRGQALDVAIRFHLTEVKRHPIVIGYNIHQIG